MNAARRLIAKAIALQLEARDLPAWQIELAREVVAEGTDAELDAVYFVAVSLADLSEPTRAELEAAGISAWRDRDGVDWLLALEGRPELLDRLEALSDSGVHMKSTTLLEWTRELEHLAAKMGVLPRGALPN